MTGLGTGMPLGMRMGIGTMGVAQTGNGSGSASASAGEGESASASAGAGAGEGEVPMPVVNIDQHSDAQATVLELQFGDRLGALLDTMKALKDLGLNVVKGQVTTDAASGVGRNKFFITRADNGKKVEEPDMLEAIRLTVINNLLQYHPAPPFRGALRPRTQAQSKMVPLESCGVKCMSMGFLMDDDAPAVWRGPMVSSALEKLVRGVAWGALDVMVIDMPPGTGDAQISITQRLPLSGAVIVSTPQDIALIDARRGANMFRTVSVPILGIVENMSYFRCGNCGHQADIFGHGGARETAEEMAIEFLGEVPLNITVRETSDGGRPIAASFPDSEEARVYARMAKRIAEKLREGPTHPALRRSIISEE
eukprot:jgi/Mesen1/3615/ME000020S03145